MSLFDEFFGDPLKQAQDKKQTKPGTTTPSATASLLARRAQASPSRIREPTITAGNVSRHTTRVEPQATEFGSHRKATTVKDGLKSIGSCALSLAIGVAMIVLAIFFIKGGVWLSQKLLPVVSGISGLAFLVCLFILTPLAVFHPTRGFAGVGLFIASYIFGLSLWMTGLLLTYTLWGIAAVFIGLFMMALGVVPFALIATLTNGLWLHFFGLIILLIATWVSRFMAIYVLKKHEKPKQIFQ